MAKKAKKGTPRPKRRAERIVEEARLEARVIVAEARADAALARMLSVQEAHAEAEQVRRDTELSARLTLEHAHTEAGWVLTKTREFVEAERRAVAAESELAAERVRAAATAAAEQLRREAVAAREEAQRELAAERTRLRDEAMLDAARLRDQARQDAAAVLGRVDGERQAILDAAHAEARRIVAGADDSRVDRAIQDLVESAHRDDASAWDELAEAIATQTEDVLDAIPDLPAGVRADDPAHQPSEDPGDPQSRHRRWWRSGSSRR